MTLEALLTMFSMCLCHWPLLLRVKPRCLWSEKTVIGIPSRIIWDKLVKCFKVNRMASVFKVLKDMSHCLAQGDRICKSRLIIPYKSIIDDAAQNRELSSANKRVKLRSDSAMSLT